MTTNNLNRRAIGGQRVAADFSMNLMNTLDSTYDKTGIYSGEIVFNARGACFFVQNEADVKSQIFPTDDTITNIAVMVLSVNGKQVGKFNNIEIKLLGQKTYSSSTGLIVKFIALSESQLDKLNELVDELPAIESDALLFTEGLKAA